jgi:hypothetical protein
VGDAKGYSQNLFSPFRVEGFYPRKVSHFMLIYIIRWLPTPQLKWVAYDFTLAKRKINVRSAQFQNWVFYNSTMDNWTGNQRLNPFGRRRRIISSF